MYSFIYVIAAVQNRTARKLSAVYIMHLMLSAIITFSAAMVDDAEAYFELAMIAILVEILTYPMGYLLLDSSSLPPIDIEYAAIVPDL